MYETKLKGHDGIACTSLCISRCYHERINRGFMFLVEIFHDAVINVRFGISIFYQHAFNVHEFTVYSIICAGNFISSVK